MKKTFEPGFTYSIEQAAILSPELQNVLIAPDRLSPDIQTVEAVSEDLSMGLERRHGVVARYAISLAHNISGVDEINLRHRFGDAIVEELFISDLLDESKRKPIVADTDNDGILRNIVFELERDSETSMQNMWESIGLNYTTAYISAMRSGFREERAVSLIRGTNPAFSAQLTPWFMKVGFADLETSQSIKQKLQINSDNHNYQDNITDYYGPAPLPYTGIFQSSSRYKDFLEHIRKGQGLSMQSNAETISNYQNAVGPFSEQSYYIDSVGKINSSNCQLLLTESCALDDLDGDLLLNDIDNRFQARLVAGRFILQTAGSFMRDSQWVRIEELKADVADEVLKIVESEKTKTVATRMSSIL